MKSHLTIGILLALGLFTVQKASAQTTPGPQPTICNRACWGARAAQCSISQMSALNRAIIHHTGNASEYSTDYETSKAKVRGNQSYSMDVLGYCDADYHFYVDGAGHIFEGRAGSMSTLPRGAHDGCNANSFGFTALGNFADLSEGGGANQIPPAAMMNALYSVIGWRMPSGWSPYGAGAYCTMSSVGTLDGHRKVKATACPGNNIYNVYITDNRSGGTMRNTVASIRTPSTAIVVDNNSAGFSASANWITASSSTDKYGADYRYHSTQAVSDTATWTANVSAGTHTVYAWWPQGSNRSTTAAYHVANSGGTTVVTVNQQINGGKWNSLGAFNFGGGNTTVQLSCWTTTGFVVVADAIKWQ